MKKPKGCSDPFARNRRTQFVIILLHVLRKETRKERGAREKGRRARFGA